MNSVGIDLHRNRSQVAVIDGNGELSLSRRIVNDRATFLELLAGLEGESRIAVEATYGWEWLAELLEDAGYEIHLAHPLRTRAIAAARVKADARVDVLTQIRGVGRYTAMLIIAEVGEIGRFPDARHLCAWAGLTPTVRSSDGKARLGRISRQGSPALRWALVEAAQKCTTGGGPLRESFERIAKRRGRKIAKVAVARQILTLSYYGLRDGEIRCLARRSRASAKEKLAVAA